MMVKVLVSQAQNPLADDRTAFSINDRRSFMRCLGRCLTGQDPGRHDQPEDAIQHGRLRAEASLLEGIEPPGVVVSCHRPKSRALGDEVTDEPVLAPYPGFISCATKGWS